LNIQTTIFAVTKIGWPLVLCIFILQRFFCCLLHRKYFVKQKDLSMKNSWRMSKPEITSNDLATSTESDGLRRSITSATNLVSKQSVTIALKSYEWHRVKDITKRMMSQTISYFRTPSTLINSSTLLRSSQRRMKNRLQFQTRLQEFSTVLSGLINNRIMLFSECLFYLIK
jgi:hypothetical protein